MKERIIKIFELFLQAILGVLDQAEPDDRKGVPPVVLDEAEWVPTIIPVKGAKYKTHGSFKTKSGKPLGAVVHYTVSGRSQAAAQNVVRYMAKEGIGCLVMDENGFFYCAENYDYMKHIVYHAGKSSYKGKTGMSQYCLGIEVCCWGTAGKEKGVTDLRLVTAKDNVKAGVYQMFTGKQEETLIRFLRYMKKMSPDFSYDWVIGHDECAPARKQDPGGSLSMTMPQLRALLK